MKETEYCINRELIARSESTWIAIKVLFVATVNVLFFSNRVISNIAVLIEIIVLIYDAIKNNWARYLGNYVLFCGLSIEYAALTNVEKVFGFKEFRIFGINMGIWTLLPVFIHYLLKNIGGTKIRNTKQKDLWKFANMYLILIIISVFMGLVLYLFNDNNVANIFSFRICIEELYQKGAQTILIIFSLGFMITKEDSNSCDIFEKYLLATLYGTVISLIISFMFGRLGNYGGVNTLVATNNVRWIPLLLIFPLYKKYKKNLFLFFIGVIGAYFLLRYNATGKNIMIYGLIPFIYVFVYFKQHRYINGLVVIALIPLMLFVGIFTISKLSSLSVLFNSKINQVISMIGSLFTTSINKMEDSPRVRILEFTYIMQEYIKKPYLALFGKGVGGTILKGNLAFDLSSFSKEELTSGLIYNVHESINKLFLSNGILGLVFLIKIVIIGIRNVKNNPWVIIGIYWLLISLGHSITMSAFGLSCLIYGLREETIDSEEI